jgi:hypothetical protein
MELLWDHERDILLREENRSMLVQSGRGMIAKAVALPGLETLEKCSSVSSAAELPDMRHIKDRYVCISAAMMMSCRLNATKAKLAAQDPQLWREHTSTTSLSYRLVPELRRAVQPELCTVAWTKMYEMLSAFAALLPPLNLPRPISTLHLCEAPGAFVCALNHYLRAKASCAIQWNWVASSLHPAHAANASKATAMIAADRFLKATAENW